MKDGFKSIEIEPVECYLDFVGPAKINDTNSRVLKGQVRISLTKPVKIRNMSIKFKGQSSVSLQLPTPVELTAPLLPKLKLPLYGRVTIPVGDHIIPWEMDIPNIYPRSIMIKRATITYKVILTISMGITRTLTAEYPIVIRRHLLPYKELAPIIETRLFQRTIPGKFHYEIDTPQIVCIEQEHIPLAIKYISFANQKEVKTIRTRLIQIELYRRQALSKAESDLSCNNKDSLILDLDRKLLDSADYKDTHIKYIKRTVPALIHIPNESASAWKSPCLIRHRLHPYMSFSLDSPMLSIYHQLEVTFQFGMKHEEVKSRIPIIIASIPKRDSLQLGCNVTTSAQSENMMLKYAFEEATHTNFLTYRLESHTSTLLTEDENEQLLIDGSYTTLRNGRTLPLMSVEDDIHSTNRYGRVSNALNSSSSDINDPRPGLVPYNSYASEQPPMNGITTLERNAIIKRSMANTTSITAAAAAVKAAQNAATQNQIDPQRFASAVELSSRSKDSSTPIDYSDGKRPRTTTPTARRQPMYKKHVPQPIDVDLANGKDTRNVSPFPPPRTQLPPPPPHRSTSSGSDVLPATDRVQQIQSLVQPSRRNIRQDSMDDLQSVYSEASASSSNNAPSLSSSATMSTNRSQPTLHSRPASPVFSPAPGLPATFALRPQQDSTAQIEETFLIDSAGATSPAMNTVASSTVFSPHSASVFGRRIALSTISSLTNNSLYIDPSVVSRDRQSATLESDILSVIMRSSAENSCVGHEPSSYRHACHAPPCPSPNHYINAKLPPIPTTTSNQSSQSKRSNRFTMIYRGESEDEDDDCPTVDPVMGQFGERTTSLPVDQLVPSSQSPSITSSSGTCPRAEGAPPRLPRLSFGNDFDFSINI
ncbi:hypothetical protein EDC96DRAFT_519006 [Choanephora cucurbitarum]|nr:hypothetical protein EDC96DRAFT_519006 [Choanephora cucurbitarum]